MEKTKEYKYIILIGLVVLGFFFYWYGYRPTEIRKRCSIVSLSAKDEELGYQICLRSFGLEK